MVKKIDNGKYKCCGVVMNKYSTSISHTAYVCPKCGKCVQTKGGWGTEDMLSDGFENKHAFVPVVV